jgi:hypothetical protein
LENLPDTSGFFRLAVGGEDAGKDELVLRGQIANAEFLRSGRYNGLGFAALSELGERQGKAKCRVVREVSRSLL